MSQDGKSSVALILRRCQKKALPKQPRNFSSTRLIWPLLRQLRAHALRNLSSILVILPENQAFVARAIRNIEAVSMATMAARDASASFGGTAAPEASSARELAYHSAPPKQAYTTKLLAEDRLSRLPFFAQLEQGLIDKLNQDMVEAKIHQ